MDNIRPIRSEADYEAALMRVDLLLKYEEGTPQDDELQVWSTLIEAYEDEQYPMDFPDPVSAIKFRLEQLGMSRKELIPLLGSASRVSEVLSGKRTLTLVMIRALHRHLGIPAEVLIREPGGQIRGGKGRGEICSGNGIREIRRDESERGGWRGYDGR